MWRWFLEQKHSLYLILAVILVGYLFYLHRVQQSYRTPSEPIEVRLGGRKLHRDRQPSAVPTPAPQPSLEAPAAQASLPLPSPAVDLLPPSPLSLGLTALNPQHSAGPETVIKVQLAGPVGAEKRKVLREKTKGKTKLLLTLEPLDPTMIALPAVSVPVFADQLLEGRFEASLNLPQTAEAAHLGVFLCLAAENAARCQDGSEGAKAENSGQILFFDYLLLSGGRLYRPDPARGNERFEQLRAFLLQASTLKPDQRIRIYKRAVYYAIKTGSKPLISTNDRVLFSLQ